MSLIDFSQIVTADDKAAAALQMAKTQARQSLTSALETAATAMTGAVPLAEQLAWSGKAAAAQAVLAGTATAEDSAILAAEAAQTGETPADLAQTVVTLASHYQQAAAWLAGLRRRYTRLIDAAGTPQDALAPLRTLAADLEAGPEAEPDTGADVGADAGGDATT